MCMGHDHSLSGIEDQGHSWSRVRVRASKDANAIGWPQSVIEGSLFSDWTWSPTPAGMVTYLASVQCLVQQLTVWAAGVRVEHSHLTIHLKRPAVVDHHRTQVGHCQVTNCLNVVEYAAKVDRHRVILKRHVWEIDRPSYQQFILLTDQSVNGKYFKIHVQYFALYFKF